LFVVVHDFFLPFVNMIPIGAAIVEQHEHDDDDDDDDGDWSSC
jgi:hypothetical protein